MTAPCGARSRCPSKSVHLKHLAAQAERGSSLRTQQPWKAAHDKDYAWLGEVITKHYRGDDSDVKVLLGGILKAFEGMTIDDYCADAERFLANDQHPTLKRPSGRAATDR